MKKVIKLTESDLNKIVKKIINESYDPDRLYDRNKVVSSLKNGPPMVRKFIKNLPIIECDNKICTKIPEFLYVYLSGKLY